MLPFIPAIVAMTLVLGYVVSMSSTEETNNYPYMISENMLHQHNLVSHEAQEGGIVSGNFGDLIAPPFRSMGDWRSVVLIQDGKTLVLTWSGEDREFPEEALGSAMGYLSGKRTRNLGISSAGPYIHTETGGMIGHVEITGYDLPIEFGDYALVSIL